MTRKTDDEVALVFTKDNINIYLKFVIAFDHPSYQVTKGSSGHGFNTFEEALADVERSYPGYKFTGVQVNVRTTINIDQS